MSSEQVHQESERQKAVAEPVVEEPQDKDFQPGDQVTAKYADDEGGEAWLPGTIEKIEDDFIFVSFLGYEEYESEKVRKEDVKAGVDESAVQNAIVEEEEAVEEDEEDPQSQSESPLVREEEAKIDDEKILLEQTFLEVEKTQQKFAKMMERKKNEIQKEKKEQKEQFELERKELDQFSLKLKKQEKELELKEQELETLQQNLETKEFQLNQKNVEHEENLEILNQFQHKLDEKVVRLAKLEKELNLKMEQILDAKNSSKEDTKIKTKLEQHKHDFKTYIVKKQTEIQNKETQLEDQFKRLQRQQTEANKNMIIEKDNFEKLKIQTETKWESRVEKFKAMLSNLSQREKNVQQKEALLIRQQTTQLQSFISENSTSI